MNKVFLTRLPNESLLSLVKLRSLFGSVRLSLTEPKRDKKSKILDKNGFIDFNILKKKNDQGTQKHNYEKIKLI